MAARIIEQLIEIPAEHERNIFGQFDEYIKKIERTLQVTLISRDGILKIVGPAPNVQKAEKIIRELLGLSIRGNTIQSQNVDYALSLTMEEKEAPLVEMDKDCICHTINGRPVKPKTLGQKALKFKRFAIFSVSAYKSRFKNVISHTKTPAAAINAVDAGRSP